MMALARNVQVNALVAATIKMAKGKNQSMNVTVIHLRQLVRAVSVSHARRLVSKAATTIPTRNSSDAIALMGKLQIRRAYAQNALVNVGPRDAITILMQMCSCAHVSI